MISVDFIERSQLLAKRKEKRLEYRTISVANLRALLPIVDKPVVVLILSDFGCVPSRSLFNAWHTLLKAYEGRYERYVVMRDEDTGSYENCYGFRDEYGAQEVPTILFFYNRKGDYVSRTGYDRKQSGELVKWMEEAFAKSEF